MGWKDGHCTGMMRVKPYLGIKDVEGALKETVDHLEDTIANLGDILVEKGLEIAKEKAKKVTVRAGAKYAGSLFGGPFAPLLAAISTGVTLVDGAYSTVTGAMEAYDLYQNIEAQIGPLEKILSQAQSQLEDVKKGVQLLEKEKAGTLTAKEKDQLKTIGDEVKKRANETADAMAAQAMADPCLEALKCTLTPYSKPTHPIEEKDKPYLGGCCPGQSGHHLPPKAYFKECADQGNYKETKALVVCVEGVNQYSGSHSKIHDWQDTFASKSLKNGDLSYEDAITASVKAHQKMYPHCGEKCIREQLERSLEQCKGTKINAINKSNGQLKPPNLDHQPGGFD